MFACRMIERSYHAGIRMTSHAHESPSMSILLRGMLRESAGRHSELALPFSVSFMAADIAHDDEFGPSGATLFQVHFDDADRELVDACRALSGWTWAHGGPASRLFLQLVRARRGNSDGALTEQLVADVLAAGMNDARSSGRPPAWLDDVRSLIDDLDGWPRVADLAGSARVHRVYLARQFRRYFGCSVSDYIRRRRVQAAALRIGSRKATLSEIAHASGFHDHAHMCRAFRRECAVSPSRFSRLTETRPSS